MTGQLDAWTPLQGLTVLELGTSVAGPTAAFILAELGAEVVKVENPRGGDDARLWGPPFLHGASPTYHAINRNKKSAALDLKDEAQRDALRRFILERVDVVLQNLRPGLVESFGLDGPGLRAQKPALIYCSLAAFGARGPLARRPGYDPLMQAFAGLMSITGAEGQEPVRIANSVIDQGAAMWAATGILGALYRRAVTGEGCLVETSLYETALAWMYPQMANYRATGTLPRKFGTENFGIAPYKAYAAADGWLVIAAGNDSLFRRLAGALGHPEWADEPPFRTNPDRVANRVRLNDLIGAIVAQAPREAWIDKLDRAGVPCAPLLTIDEVAAHPQFEAVAMSQSHPGSDIALLGLPLQFDGRRPPLRNPAPDLGAQTHEVLSPAPAGPPRADGRS